MDVDVTTEIVIARPRRQVAAYAADPDNATIWYANISRIEWRSEGPLDLGSQIEFQAEFLGRRLVYTYEVKELVPGERFVMSTAQGPFAMETTYAWADAPGGGTRMTMRNRGRPTGFSKLVAPMLAASMRRANQRDLATLKSLLESASPSSGPSP